MTVHEGDIGTVIALDTGIDLSTAIVTKIVGVDSVGDTFEWTAVVSGTELTYTTVDGDIFEGSRGIWTLQSYVEMPTWEGYGAIVEMPVNRRLKNAS